MSTALVKCPKCQALLDAGELNHGLLAPCPSCQTPIEALAYPALLRKTTPGVEGERIIIEGEASCFYHPGKKAVRPCDGCGRFVCALCDCELHGEHYCPACLEAGRKKGKIKNLENRRVLYDSIALKLSLYPWLFIITYFVSIIAAPVSIFIAIRHWKAPLSIVRRSKYRLVLAIIFSLLQIAGWIFVVYLAILGYRNRDGAQP